MTAAQPAPTAGYLLLVEDNPGDARLTQALLGDLPAAGLPPLRWVQTAAAAVTLLQQEPGCAAVLLDLGLPDSTGLESLQAVTREHHHLPVIVLTGNDSAPMGLDAVGSGAQDFLVKGHFDAAALVRSIVFATQRKRGELALVERSLRDDLTGLPRRTLLLDRLQAACRQARRSGETSVLLFVDLDGFKQINDAHGHDAGDAVLRATAQRLVAGVRSSDSVARLGGDEFALLLPSAASLDAAERVADKLLASLAAPIPYNGELLQVGASIGMTLVDADAESPETLLRRADAAMYGAKRAGKGRVQRC
ncbi:diguanylate cyclase domain-containing protein [Roseateles sp. LKC17W]|uniref:Diguanylate cyclase domain-containing protein n=1 Tax=Pelomonas margarita TaxID=3299031 RepID=A0ABW7FEZ0_9BURK